MVIMFTLLSSPHDGCRPLQAPPTPVTDNWFGARQDWDGDMERGERRVQPAREYHVPGVKRKTSTILYFIVAGGEEGGAPKLIWHINWEIMPTQCGLMETAGCCCVPLCNSGHLLANVKGTSVSTLIKDGNIWQERPRKRPVAKQLWRDSLHMWGWLCTLLDIRPDRQWLPPQTDGGWRGAAGLPVGDLTTNSGESSTI